MLIYIYRYMDMLYHRRCQHKTHFNSARWFYWHGSWLLLVHLQRLQLESRKAFPANMGPSGLPQQKVVSLGTSFLTCCPKSLGPDTFKHAMHTPTSKSKPHWSTKRASEWSHGLCVPAISLVCALVRPLCGRCKC